MERMSAVTERDTLTDCGRGDLDIVTGEPVASRPDLFKRIELIFVHASRREKLFLFVLVPLISASRNYSYAFNCQVLPYA